MHNLESSSCGYGASSVTGLLRHLQANELTRLRSHLEALTVSRGTKLFDVGEVGRYLYFPQGPLVSLQEASGFEVALIGSEGLVGWPALVGVTSSPFRALVRARDGVVLRMPLDAAIATMSCAPGIAGLYNRFVTVLGVQMAESMKACASHRIETRLARWILLRHDRVGGDEILVQHDEIADDLSSRRASITDSLHVIEGTGLVRCRRGRLLVRDRHALENLARGYYGSAEAIYREVIGRFGKGSLASGIGGLPVAQRGLTGKAGAADDGDPCN